jgi:uncharacterized protein YqiB (DUF1249 family)
VPVCVVLAALISSMHYVAQLPIRNMLSCQARCAEAHANAVARFTAVGGGSSKDTAVYRVGWRHVWPCTAAAQFLQSWLRVCLEAHWGTQQVSITASSCAAAAVIQSIKEAIVKKVTARGQRKRCHTLRGLPSQSLALCSADTLQLKAQQLSNWQRHVVATGSSQLAPNQVWLASLGINSMQHKTPCRSMLAQHSWHNTPSQVP